MPYDENLADRIITILEEKDVSFVEKKMMGGLCFMVDGKMCMGIVKEKLMARIDPAIYDECLKIEGCHEMDFTKKPMKGFVFVEPEVLDTDDELEYWVNLCLEFNPKAKRSKKK